MTHSHELRFLDADTCKEENLDDATDYFVSFNKISTKRNEFEHVLLLLLFNWFPINLIKDNFETSDQHTRAPDF